MPVYTEALKPVSGSLGQGSCGFKWVQGDLRQSMISAVLHASLMPFFLHIFQIDYQLLIIKLMLFNISKKINLMLGEGSKKNTGKVWSFTKPNR